MRARWIALGIVAVGVLPRAAWAYTNEDLGFSFNLPGGYNQIPIASEEQYIVARWQSERRYYEKGEEGYFQGFKPEIKVILFDPKAKISKESKEIGDGVTLSKVKNPYKNYKEYVKSDGTGGRYISKEEDITVNGVATTWYEVAYEKLTVPRHGLAFVYHAEDVDYCVTMEVLEQDWKKLSSSLLGSLKSFKIFPRKSVLKRETTGGDIEVRDKSKPETPEESLKRRREAFDRKLKLCVDRLPKGWNRKESDSKSYIALTHADAKFTALVLDQADGIRQWADENLGFFGDGIPTPRIIRIFKDWDEESAFRDTSNRSGSSGGSGEITLSWRGGWWGLGNVASEIYREWLRDKAPDLYFSLPRWLDRGISEYVSKAYFHAGKLDFRPDVDTAAVLKLAAKQNTLIKVRDLMMMSNKDLMQADSPGLDRNSGFSSGAYQQNSGFVRYLLAGPGRTNPLTKDLLKVYVTNLDAYVQERETLEKDKLAAGAKDPMAAKAPETEEEEEARFKEAAKKREDFWGDDTREKELLKVVFDKTFGAWKESDWAALEKSYRTFVD